MAAVLDEIDELEEIDRIGRRLIAGRRRHIELDVGRVPVDADLALRFGIGQVVSGASAAGVEMRVAHVELDIRRRGRIELELPEPAPVRRRAQQP